jgi:hypothetical protein
MISSYVAVRAVRGHDTTSQSKKKYWCSTTVLPYYHDAIFNPPARTFTQAG